MMRFILPALALAVLVSGCVSDEKQRARDMRLDNNRCQSMGFEPGSQALAKCMATASDARQADKDRAYVYSHTPAGPPMVGQPGYVAPSSDDDDNRDTPPMNCRTTESTSTNDNGTTVTRSRQRCSSF
jgi:hypothetical protein